MEGAVSCPLPAVPLALPPLRRGLQGGSRWYPEWYPRGPFLAYPAGQPLQALDSMEGPSLSLAEGS